MMGFTPPEEGGSERHIYELSKRIPDCTVFTQKGSLCSKKKEISLLVNKPLFIRNLLFLFFSFLYSFTLLFKKKYKIVHVHENLLYLLIPLLKLRHHVIVTVHGINGFKFYDNKFLWFFFKFPLKFANKIIAVNTEDEKKLKTIFGKKVVYIPNGVDLSFYKQKSVKIENKITFIGRIHEQKGIIYLLKAFSELENKNSELKLEIIGKINDYALELKKLFPSKRIIWRGFMEDKSQIVKSLSSAYCITLPSLWEGLPLTLFESLASGRPVIVSDIPAFKSVISSQAIFCKPNDAQDLKNKIIFLMKNKLLAKKLGESGKKLSKNYDWEVIAKNTLSAYEN